MAQSYIGSNVSLKVGGGLGFYQGQVKGVDPHNQAITLTKVVHNGKPSPAHEVTISAQDILSLDLLPIPSDKKSIEPKKPKQNTADKIANSKKSSTPTKSAAKQVQIPTAGNSHAFHPVSGTKDSNYRHNANQSPAKPGNRRRQRGGQEFYEEDHFVGSPRNAAMGHDYMKRNDRTQPQKRQQRHKQRNDTTFGTPLEDDMDTEFDFEGNLALFDKQAVREELENLNRPDVVQQTDKKPQRNYRWDERIIEPEPDTQVCRQIIVPLESAGEIVYTTDNGLLVPSISTELRVKLLSTAVQLGLTNSRQLEMIGRGATELILSTIGGSHRLEPNNSHQTPVVVVLCGVHMQGAAGANCARQLEGHGVRTVLVTPSTPSGPNCMSYMQEIKLYSMTAGKVSHNVDNIPQTVDFIVDARFDLEGQLGVTGHTWLSAVHNWTTTSRAPVAALDPPSDTTPVAFPLSTRMKLSPILPLAHFPEKSQIYLLNVNIPQKVYSDLDIKFTTPFGAKMYLQLHSCE